MAIRGPVIDATDPRYIKHPPGGSGWLRDGMPLDSGTAHIIHNNLSQLANQGTRHLGVAPGPGYIGAAETSGLWTSPGFIDVSLEDGADEYGQHPWVIGKSACVFGPFAPAFTRFGIAPAGMYPRRVRVVIQFEKSATVSTTLTIMAALVKGAGGPLRAPMVAKRSLQFNTSLSGQRLVQLDLPPNSPLAPTASWPSDVPGSGVPSDTPVCPLWLWVGWLSDDPGTSEGIFSISATELAE